ncbi:hypothetical protein QYF61_000775, partial [Mycteria americana]
MSWDCLVHVAEGSRNLTHVYKYLLGGCKEEPESSCWNIKLAQKLDPSLQRLQAAAYSVKKRGALDVHFHTLPCELRDQPQCISLPYTSSSHFFMATDSCNQSDYQYSYWENTANQTAKRGEHLGWRLHHFPGQPVPMLDNPFREEKFPDIQSKPPLAQLEAISSCPITCYLGEETDPHLSTTSFQ